MHQKLKYEIAQEVNDDIRFILILRKLKQNHFIIM